MKYLPFEKITFRTKLSEEEVIKRLKKHLEPNKLFKLNNFNFDKNNDNKYKYKGWLLDNNFQLIKINFYHKPFNPYIKNSNQIYSVNYNFVLPVVTGTISKEFDGTYIKTIIRINYITINLFISIILFFIMLLISDLFFNNSESYSKLLIFPSIILTFVYFLTLFGFKLESNKSKQDLQKMFDAEIIEE